MPSVPNHSRRHTTIVPDTVPFSEHVVTQRRTRELQRLWGLTGTGHTQILRAHGGSVSKPCDEEKKRTPALTAERILKPY